MDKLVKWLENLLRAQKKSRAWRTFVSCLAAIVVFTMRSLRGEVVIPGDEDESAERADRSSHQGKAGNMAHAAASESGPDRSRRAKKRCSADGGAAIQPEERIEPRSSARYCKTRT